MVEWERPLGIFVIFVFCYFAMVFSDDKKLKFISYFTAIITALALIGWSNDIITNAQQLAQNITQNMNATGVVTSLAGLGLSPLAPSKSLRRTGYSLSASGLTAALLGLPTWVMWVIIGAIAIAIIVSTYFIFKKIARWFTTLIQGGGNHGK